MFRKIIINTQCDGKIIEIKSQCSLQSPCFSMHRSTQIETCAWNRKTSRDGKAKAPLQQSCRVATAVGRRHRRVAARHRASFAAAASAPVLTAPPQVLCQHGRARSVAGAAKLRAAGVADVKARAKPPLRCCAGPRFSCADTCRAAGSGGRHRSLLRGGPQRAQIPQVHAKLQVLKRWQWRVAYAARCAPAQRVAIYATALLSAAQRPHLRAA